ncbi:hypothetical protein GGS21DRAFT_34885 [Xylaria nigripes]|nr:hypothetical protein GGS21DRAFT_34885 [Xylaria nigripes]
MKAKRRNLGYLLAHGLLGISISILQSGVVDLLHVVKGIKYAATAVSSWGIVHICCPKVDYRPQQRGRRKKTKTYFVPGRRKVLRCWYIMVTWLKCLSKMNDRNQKGKSEKFLGSSNVTPTAGTACAR